MPVLGDLIVFVYHTVLIFLAISAITVGTVCYIRGEACEDLRAGGTTLIVIGVILVFIAILGVLAVWNQSSYWIRCTCGVLLLVVTGVMLSHGINAEVRRIEGKSYISRRFRKARADDNSKAMGFVASTQASLQCCGIYGPTFWTSAAKPIPESCCQETEEECDLELAFQDGCEERFAYFMRMVAITGLIVAVFAAIGAVLTCRCIGREWI